MVMPMSRVPALLLSGVPTSLYAECVADFAPALAGRALMNSSGVTPRVPDSCATHGRAALVHAMAPMPATTIAILSSDLSQQRSFAIIPHSQLQLTNRNSRLASRQQEITNHEEQLNHQITNLPRYQILPIITFGNFGSSGNCGPNSAALP
jgi:hypothetical protein